MPVAGRIRYACLRYRSKLNLVPLPAVADGLVAFISSSLTETASQPGGVAARAHGLGTGRWKFLTASYQFNRFFLWGDRLLILEFMADTPAWLQHRRKP